MVKKIRIILIPVMIISAIIAGFGISKTVKLLRVYDRSTEVYAALSSKTEKKAESKVTQKPLTKSTAEDPDKTDNSAAEEFPETSPIEIDFEEMHGNEGRGQISGWLYLPDSPIDYPVMYAGDNAYYLDHLWDGEANISGTPFIDVRNAPDFTDRNTIIYGHHMANKTMFGSLDYYLKKDYSDSHPSIYLNTPDKNYRLDFAGCYITDSESDAFEVQFDDNSDFAGYKNTAKSRFVNSSDIEITAEDRIVTLVTCNYSYNNARLICIFRMTRIG